MKAVIDAVNALNGDLEFANQGDSVYPYLLVDAINGSYWRSIMGSSAAKSSKKYNYICTVDEFNACVDELSAATWIDGISIEQWKAGMKNTVTDSHGNKLEIGKVYEFSDDQESWRFDKLEGCNDTSDDNDYEFKGAQCNWIFIRECQSPLGTIKKAPVKLVDGKAYQFDLDGTKKVGVWHDDIGSFFDGFDGPISEICTRSEATRIIPLVPEVK